MSHKARVIGAIALAGSLMGFSWSDWWPPAFLQPWWPPALQQKIGELEAKVNAAETEKSALLKKVTEVSQAADDCKAQSQIAEHKQAGQEGQEEIETGSLSRIRCRMSPSVWANSCRTQRSQRMGATRGNSREENWGRFPTSPPGPGA